MDIADMWQFLWEDCYVDLEENFNVEEMSNKLYFLIVEMAEMDDATFRPSAPQFALGHKPEEDFLPVPVLCCSKGPKSEAEPTPVSTSNYFYVQTP